MELFFEESNKKPEGEINLHRRGLISELKESQLLCMYIATSYMRDIKVTTFMIIRVDRLQ